MIESTTTPALATLALVTRSQLRSFASIAAASACEPRKSFKHQDSDSYLEDIQVAAAACNGPQLGIMSTKNNVASVSLIDGV
jgi:hypothetical protein